MKIVVVEQNLLAVRERFESELPSDTKVHWHSGVESLEFLDDLRDADVYVGGRFTARMADVADKLRLVHVAGAGTDRVDFAALRDDVLLANTFHHERSMAEYVVSAAVLLRRDSLSQDRALRADVWVTSVYDPAIAKPSTLSAALVGFVGFGHIGQCTWELFRAFGARGAAVTGSGRVDADRHGLAWAGDTTRLDELMRESDVVVVSAPLNVATTGMIGADQLRALGSDGVLINVGRGPLVDENALYEALLQRRIRAAAIDVWYRYPGSGGHGAPSGRPFGELTNILMTPHSSGVTTDTFQGRLGDITANIGRLQRGEPLINVVAH